MINVISLMGGGKDAGSLYRGHIAIQDMVRKGMIYCGTLNEFSMDSLGYAHVLYIARAYSSDHLKIIQIAKRVGVKVITDYDDNFFEVPRDNPCYADYMQPQSKKRIAEIIALSDAVTVSTKELKRFLGKRSPEGHTLNDNIFVVPNSFDTRIFTEKKTFNTLPIVAWRGSNTHQKDISQYTQEMISVSKDHPEWEWHFCGYDPWWLTELLPKGKVKYTETISVMDFLDYFRAEVTPSIVVVPLADHAFNRAKSNIAYIEATYAGAVCLAPDWEEWRRPGCVTYKNHADFETKLRMLMNDGMLRRANVERAWDYLEKCLDIYRASEKRLEIMKAVLGRGSFPEEEGTELE